MLKMDRQRLLFFAHHIKQTLGYFENFSSLLFKFARDKGTFRFCKR